MAFQTKVAASVVDRAFALNVLKQVNGGAFKGNVLSTMPIKGNVKGGDLFVLLNPGIDDKQFLLGDDITWGLRQTIGKTDKNPVIQRYYYLKVGKGRDYYMNAFKRHVFNLKDCEGPYLIHYIGNHQLCQESIDDVTAEPMNNDVIENYSVQESSFEIEEKDSVEGDIAVKNELVLSSVETEAESLEENDPASIVENVNDVRTFTERKNDIHFELSNPNQNEFPKPSISCDSLSSLMKLRSSVFGETIKEIKIESELVVIFENNQAMDLAKRILKRKRFLSLQCISCKTSVDLGGFYITTISMRNTELETNPFFDLIYILHENKYPEETLKNLWLYLYKELPLLEQGAQKIHIPILVDYNNKKFAEVMAQSSIYNENNFLLCSTQISQNFASFLDEKGIPGAPLYREQIFKLIECETLEDFDYLYETFGLGWPSVVQTFADSILKKDLRNHGIAAHFKRFDTFQQNMPNLEQDSEEIATALSSRLQNIGKLTYDQAVLIYILKQLLTLQEFERAYRNNESLLYTVKTKVKAKALEVSFRLKLRTVEDIVDSVISGTYDFHGSADQPSGTVGLAKRNLVHECSGLYMVKDQNQKNRVNVVNFEDPELLCSCASRKTVCYHVLATKNFQKDNPPEVKEPLTIH